MLEDLPAARAVEPRPFPVAVVCPICHRGLDRLEHSLRCPPCDRAECPRQFAIRDGFPDLVVGERFPDPTDGECMCYEEGSNEYTARRFWVPLFCRLWPSPERAPRLLALGCGTGVEVDVLADAGFEVVGVDNGNRTKVWPRRRRRDALLLANGLHLPFEDASFDAVFCGCLFPHVGVVGDSFVVTKQYREDRLALAREMSRVLRPGGCIVASSPNRKFPFDIFHGRRPGSYTPRPNWPADPFLLSVADYRGLLRDAGCSSVTAQPIAGYWGFVRSRHAWRGFLLALPVRLLFWLVDRPWLGVLRESPLAPWIVVLARK